MRQPFVVGHPERLVAPVIQVREVIDRPSATKPKLVQVAEPGGCVGVLVMKVLAWGKRQCVEPVFAVGFDSVPCSFVAAALADHVEPGSAENPYSAG